MFVVRLLSCVVCWCLLTVVELSTFVVVVVCRVSFDMVCCVLVAVCFFVVRCLLVRVVRRCLFAAWWLIRVACCLVCVACGLLCAVCGWLFVV